MKNWESNTSTDCENINMLLVKKVINCIEKPITYICNLSFTTGVLPEKLKIAKGIPLFKSGDKYKLCALMTGLFHYCHSSKTY